MELGQLVISLLFDDSSFTDGVKDAESSAQRLGSNLSSLASTLNKVLVGAFVAAAAAATAFVATSLAIGARFDKEITVVRALLNASEEDFGRLTDRARELGATTEFTATQAATGLQNFARAGLDVNEAIAAVGPSLDLATAAATDLNQATASVASTLAQFQLGADQSSRVSDVLANAAASTKFSLEGLTVALRRAGPAGNALGLSLEETVSAVSQFRNLGLEASQSGRVFEAVLKRLVRPSKAAQDAIAGLGLSLDDVNPEEVPFDQLLVRLREAGAGAADFGAIFGQFGLQIAGVADTVDDAEKGFNALTETLQSGVGRAAELAAQQSQNLLTQLQILRSGVEEVFLSVFDAIRGPSLQVLESVVQFIQEVSRQFKLRAGEVEGSAQRIADAISGFIDSNRSEFASTVVNLAQGVGELAESIVPLISGLAELTPLLVGMVNVAADNPAVVALAAAVTSLGLSVVALLPSIASAVTIMSGLGVSMTSATATVASFGAGLNSLSRVLLTSTAGLAGIALAATNAITSIIDLIDKQRQAAREARSLQAAQEASEEQALQRQNQIEALSGPLSALKDQFSEAADLGFDEADKELIRLTGNFDAAATAAAIAEGRIVRLGESFATTSEFIRRGGDDARQSLEAQIDALREQASAARTAAIGLTEFAKSFGDIDRNTIGLDESVFEAAERDAFALISAVTTGLDDVGQFSNRIAERQEAEGLTRLQALEKESLVTSQRLIRHAESSESEADNREKRVTTIVEEEASNRAKAALDLLSKQEEIDKRAGESAKKASDDRVKAAQDASDSLTGILDRERAAALSALPQAEQIRAAFDAELSEIQSFVDGVRQSAGEGSGALVAAEETAAQTRVLARARLNSELLSLTEAAQDDALSLAQSGAAQVAQAETDALEGREKILREGAARLASVVVASATERAAIEEALQAELAEISLSEIETEEARQVRLEQTRLTSADRLVSLAIRTNQRVSQEQASTNDQLITLEERLTQEKEKESQARIRLAEQEAQAIQQTGEDLVSSFTSGPTAFSAIGDALTNVLGNLATSVDEAGNRTENSFGKVVRGLGQVVRTAATVSKATFKAVTGIATRLVKLFDSVTGGFISGLNPLAIVGDITNGLVAAEEAVQKARDAISDGTGTLEDLRAARDALRDEQRRVNSGSAGREAVSDLSERALTFTQALSASLGPLLQQLANDLPRIISAASSGLKDALKAIGDNIPNIADAIIEGADGFVNTIVESLPDVASALISTIGRSSSSLFGNIGVLIDGLLDGLSGLIDEFVTQIPESLGALSSLIGGIIENVLSNIGNIIGSIIKAVTAIIRTLPTLVTDIINGILTGVTNLIKSFAASLPGLITDSAGLITDLITGIIDGILETAFNGIDIVADLLVSTLEMSPQITQDLVFSFFKILTQALGLLGPTIIRTIFGFFEGGGGTSIGERLGNAFGNVAAESLKEFFASIGDLFTDTFSISPDQLQFFTDAFSAVKMFFTDFVDNIKDTFVALFERVRDFFANIFGGGGGGGFLGGLFGGGGAGAQGGIDFVQRAQGIIVHPGEAILTAQQNSQRLGLSGVASNPTAPVNRDGAFTPNPGGSGPITVVVRVGPEEIARSMVQLDRSGGAAVTNRLTRKKSRTRVGFKRAK